MHTMEDYVLPHEKGKVAHIRNSVPDFRRMRREIYIYNLINSFDAPVEGTDGFLPVAAKGLTGYSKKQLSLNTKRRIRNEIVRNIMADGHTGDEIYEPEVILDAFFKTNYGKTYDDAENREKWANQYEADMRAVIDSWTTERVYPAGSNNAGHFLVSADKKTGEQKIRAWFVISPYDPMFSNASCFDDKHDTAVFAARHVSSKPDEWGKSPAVRNLIGRNYYSNSDFIGVCPTHKQPNRFGTFGVSDENVVPLYDKPNVVFYNDLLHYAKTNENKRALADLLNTSRDISADEQSFALDVCRLLSERGVDFNIEAVSFGNNKRIVARMGGRSDIRLIDVNEPEYQGRLYDGTNVVMVLPDGVGRNYRSNLSGSADESQRLAVGCIDNEMRLNAIKHYLFGDDINVSIDFGDGIDVKKYDDLKVGEYGTVTVPFEATHKFYGLKQNSKRNAVLNRSIKNTVRTAAPKSFDTVISSTTYTLLAVRPYDSTIQRQDGTSITYNNLASICMVVRPVNDTNVYLVQNVKDDEFGKPAALATFFDSNDIDSLYSNDITIDSEDGEPLYLSFKENVAISEERRAYYQALYNRNQIEKIVDSAKARHRDAVNLDGIFNYYSDSKASLADSNDTNGANPFSDDEDIFEVQQLYWNYLTGNADINALNKYFDDGDDTPLSERSDDEKKEAIRRHYQAYLDESFGFVPKIHLAYPKDGSMKEEIDAKNALVDEYNASHPGFDPWIVAKHMAAIGHTTALSVQRDLKHCMMKMGPFWENSFIRDSENTMVNSVKNSAIRYDANTAAVKSARGINLYIPSENKFADLDNPDDIALLKISQGDIVDEFVESMKNKPHTREMLKHVAVTMRKSGCDPTSIFVNIDDNGIIRYEGNRNISMSDGVSSLSNTKPEIKNSGLFVGYLGQLFEPDENGAIIPKRLVESTNKVLIPGYNAYLVASDFDNPEPVRDRLRLVGWDRIMKNTITKCIHKHVYSNPDEYSYVPHTTDLDAALSQTYNSAMSIQDYRDRLDESKSSPEEVLTMKHTVQTLSGRCRFPNAYDEGSTTMAQSMLEHPERPESNAYDFSVSDLCDNMNFRVLGREFDGIFDPEASGTAKTQGIVRYLAEGVKVDPDTAKPIPIEDFDENDPPKCALMNDRMLQSGSFNSWDRVQMVLSQLLSAVRTPDDCKMAMCTIEGFNYDDGIVVTKRFADRVKIKRADGTWQSLMAQDKLSETNGNKGVIPYVADPDEYLPVIAKKLVEDGAIPFDEDNKVLGDTVDYNGSTYSIKRRLRKAMCIDDIEDLHNDLDGIVREKYGITDDKQVREFAGKILRAAQTIQIENHINNQVSKIAYDNPTLDVMISPYGPVSRHNGGAVRLPMEGELDDLIINGKVYKNCIGTAPMIVTDKLAEVKTHVYDEDTAHEGRGRHASGQFIWAMNAKNDYYVLSELFGSNDAAWNNAREYFIAVGLDLTSDLQPVIGYHEQKHRGEHRRLIEMPDDEFFIRNGRSAKASNGELTVGSCLKKDGGFRKECEDALKERAFKELSSSGGFIELPFCLNFRPERYSSIDRQLSGDNPSGTDDNTKLFYDMFNLKETGNVRDGRPTYGVPVLPPSLRSGQDFSDGTSRVHDYTNEYMNIYMNAAKYTAYQKYLDTNEGLETDISKDVIMREMEKLKEASQNCLDRIVGDITDRKFNTKHNVFRDDIMSVITPASATAVISPDRTLAADEVAMSEDMLCGLGLMRRNADTQKCEWVDPTNKRVLLFRDPILNDGNIRDMRVVVDNTVTGVKINPAMDKSFDGDFDGDTYGVMVLKSSKARKHATREFNVVYNLLDKSVDKDENGNYPLYVNDGMDMTAIMAADETGELRKRYDTLVKKANMLDEQIVKLDKGKDISDFEYDAVKYKVSSGERPHQLKDENGSLIPERDKNGEVKTVHLTGWDAFKALKVDCMEMLNGHIRDCFKGAGTDYICFESPKTIVESFSRIAATGAKGDFKKVRSLMDNIGITYEEDENGVPIAETAKNITHLKGDTNKACPAIIRDSERDGKDYYRENRMAVQETVAYKADNTSLGGTVAQNLVAAFRDITPENSDDDVLTMKEVLNLAAPITQAILDSKKDPIEAKAKDYIVRFWYRDILEGYKLTGSWKTDDPEVLKNELHEKVIKTVKKGNRTYETPMRCRPDEWIEQMTGAYRALKVDVNHDSIRKMAKALTDEDGYIMGISNYTSRKGTIMDKIAYTGRFSELVRVAALNTGETPANVVEAFESRGATSGSLIGTSVDTLVARQELVEQKRSLNTAYEREKAALGENNPSLVEKEATYRAKKRELNEAIEDTTKKLNNLAPIVPVAIVRQMYADKVNEGVTAGDYIVKNVVYTKTGAKLVPAVPLGRKDAYMSPADMFTNTRFMGETTEAYNDRMNNLESIKEEQAEKDNARLRKEMNIVSTDVIDKTCDTISAKVAKKTDSLTVGPNAYGFA